MKAEEDKTRGNGLNEESSNGAKQVWSVTAGETVYQVLINDGLHLHFLITMIPRVLVGQSSVFICSEMKPQLSI